MGNAIVDHPDVSVISFTGSTEVGKKIAARAGATLKRVSLELGGKNAQIVMDDADLDLALEGALWGAFGTTGQRCTATSRLILHEKIAEKFTAMLVASAKKLRVGNGLDEKIQMGPCVNKGQRDTVKQYVEIGLKEDEAHAGTGRQGTDEGRPRAGLVLRADHLHQCDADMRIAQEEIFGPVLSVIRVKSFDEAIKVLNNTALRPEFVHLHDGT